MKKFIFLLMLLPALAHAQDTTNVTMFDSAKMYSYKNVYAVISTVNVVAPGGYRLGNFLLNGANTDTTKWITNVSVKVYSSKKDAVAGKPELFITYCPALYTDKFPTQKEILDRLRAAIK